MNELETKNNIFYTAKSLVGSAKSVAISTDFWKLLYNFHKFCFISWPILKHICINMSYFMISNVKSMKYCFLKWCYVLHVLVSAKIAISTNMQYISAIQKMSIFGWGIRSWLRAGVACVCIHESEGIPLVCPRLVLHQTPVDERCTPHVPSMGDWGENTTLMSRCSKDHTSPPS